MFRTYGNRTYVYSKLKIKNTRYKDRDDIRKKEENNRVLYHLGDIYKAFVLEFPRLKKLKDQIRFKKPKKKQGEKGMFTPGQMDMVRNVELDDEDLEKSGAVGGFAKNMSQVALLNEKITKEFKNSGRLVDISEAETYARQIIRNMVKTIMDLPKMDANYSDEFNITASEARAQLEFISNYLMQTFKHMEGELEEYTEGFIAKVIASGGYNARTSNRNRATHVS